MPPLLEARSLSKFYPIKRAARGAKLHAVDNVDLMIGVGESVGLVGELGCGKSTMVRLLGRLIDPTSGQILLDDEDITGMSQAKFASTPGRRRIQVVFQDATESLNPSFRVFQSIADPLKPLLGLRDSAEIAKQVHATAALVGLPQELLQRYPHQLSGGQRARVGIARAIAVEPSLLILDEPTSALDVSVQAVILRLLADLKSRLTMSYLFVSHDLNVVRLLCSRVVVMYLGKIVEIAPAGDPLHRTPSPLYASVGCRDPRSGAAGRGASAAPRQSDEPDRSRPECLPLLRPLPQERRSLRQGDASASCRRPRPFHRLPLRSFASWRKYMSTDNEICRMDAVSVAARVKDKTLSAVEVADAVLRRMEKLEPHIHAFCTPTPDVARAAAAAVDAKIAAGEDPGPLAGVPIGIQGPRRHQGYPDRHGVAALPRLRAGRGRYRGRAAQGGRGCHHRQDQRAGIRLQRCRPQSGFPRYSQSLESRHDVGRIERRFRRLGRGRRRPVRDRLRWRGINPHSIGALRALRHEGFDGPGAVVSGMSGRTLSRRVQLGIDRTCRPHEPNRRQFRANAEGDHRTRPARPLFHSSSRLRLCRSYQREHQGSSHCLQRGLGLRARRSGSPPRCLRGGSSSRNGSRLHGGARQSRLGGPVSSFLDHRC